MLGSNSEGFWWFCNVVGNIFLAWIDCRHSFGRQGQCQSLLNGTEWSSSPHVVEFLSCQEGCLPGWQWPHPQSTYGRAMVWLAWHWCYYDVMAFSVTKSEPKRAFMGYSGTTPETVFPTSIKQTRVDWLCCGRMVPYPSCRIPNAGGLYAIVHTGRTGSTWWPNTLLNDFTLVFPFFFLSTTCRYNLGIMGQMASSSIKAFMYFLGPYV